MLIREINARSKADGSHEVYLYCTYPAYIGFFPMILRPSDFGWPYILLQTSGLARPSSCSIGTPKPPTPQLESLAP